MATLRRLFRTTAIRLALYYAVLYALLIAIALGGLYWATSRFIEEQLAADLTDELSEFIHIDQTLGRNKLREALSIESSMGSEDQRYFLLLAADNSYIIGNMRKWPANAKTDAAVHNISIADDLLTNTINGGTYDYATIATRLKDGAQLLIAQNTHEAGQLKEFISLIIAIILPLSALLALTMGMFLGRTILTRVDKIRTTAGAIASGDLSQRVTLTGQNDEFDELARHLNAMLARIEQLITGMRRVTDNVAHDLRRPLSRLRNRLDVILLESRSHEEYVEAIQQTIVDADEILQTFNALLEIAQTEAGSFRGEWQRINLSDLGQNLGELYQDVAEETGIAIELQISPDIMLRGNRHLLAQAIRNLLENAIQYAGQGGSIRLSIDELDEKPRLVVSDQGTGIPEGQRKIVLERFARLEAARNSPGSGLGLSLVKAVADLHQAELLLEDNQPGLRVTLLFSPTAQ